MFAKAIELIKDGHRVALVTVVATRGSTPRKPGARMIVTADNVTYGTIGGGRVEAQIIETAHSALKSGQPTLVQCALTAELAMCCGGEMTFFVEPLMPLPELIIFGLGHVGQAIGDVAARLDFKISGVEDFVNLEGLHFGPDTYVVIATREHQVDQKLLEFCINKPWRYLGVIGSERKAAMQRERLQQRGFDPARIAKVRCPMGLDINAETPEEIAISVCAQLIRERRTPT